MPENYSKILVIYKAQDTQMVAFLSLHMIRLCKF